MTDSNESIFNANKLQFDSTTIPHHLPSEWQVILSRHLAAILDCTMEDVVACRDQGKRLSELGASLQSVRYAMGRMDLAVRSHALETWDRVAAFLGQIESGDEAAVVRLTDALPRVHYSPGTTVVDAVTFVLLEQVVLCSNLDPRHSWGNWERLLTSPSTVDGWMEPDRNWFLAIPSRFNERDVHRLLAGGCRHLFSSEPQISVNDPGTLATLDLFEKFVSDQTGRSLLKSILESLSKQFKGDLSDTALQLSLQAVLCESDSLPALKAMAQAIASAYRLTDAQCAVHFRSLAEDVCPPTRSNISPTWRTSEVVAIAERMSQSRDFTDLPRLAARLRDAGCTSDAILEHCHHPDAVHTHGCWVIEGILSGGSAATKQLAKPQKPVESPLLAAMKPSERRSFKSLIENPQLMFKEDWHRRFAQVWDTEHCLRLQGENEESIRAKFTNAAELFPNASRDQQAFVWALRTAYFGTGLERRIWFDDPFELVRGLSIHVRSIWLSSYISCNGSDAVHVILDALAVRDSLAIDRFLRIAMGRPALAWDESFLPMNGILAVARRDQEAIQTVASRMANRAATFMPDVESIVQAIAARNPRQVADTIQHVIDADRAARDRQSWGVCCLEAHQLYGLAAWFSPELVSEFDGQQAFPWDTPFHEAVNESTNPLAGVDLSSVSPDLHRIMVNMELPDWLTPSPVVMKDRQQLRDVVLMNVGQRSSDVAKYLRDWMEVKVPEIKRRMQTLPLTIRLQLPSDAAERIQAELAELGAQVELFPVVSADPVQ